MKGRPILAFVAAIAGAWTLAGCNQEELPPPSDGPNIVLITTDDQALDSFNREVMPETTRLLVDGGTVPQDFTVTTPLCCPSRASLLTGQYGHNNGVLANRYALLEDPESTLPVWLRDAGYRTAHVGKYLNNYEKQFPGVRPAPGWDRWATVVGASYFDYELHLEDGSTEHGSEPSDYLSRVITRHARRAIAEQASAERPLFLQVDYYAPHEDPSDDRRCGDAALPDPRDARRFLRPALPRPPSFDERDVSDLPPFLQSPPLSARSIATLERQFGCTLAAMRGVDRGVGEIFESLRAAGELEETVVVFMSDNGLMRGQHRFGAGKHVAFEETQRVPIAMRVPAKLLGGSRPPPRLRGPAANIDIAPTLLDLAGAEPCDAEGECRVMDGRSLVPALAGKAPLKPGRALLVELDEGADPERFVGPCRYRGLRVGGLLYVEHEIAQSLETGECVEVDDRELYDLRRDPLQLRNLLPPGGGDRESEGLAARLAARVERMGDCQGIDGRDPRPPDGVSYCD